MHTAQCVLYILALLKTIKIIKNTKLSYDTETITYQ